MVCSTGVYKYIETQKIKLKHCIQCTQEFVMVL